MKEIYGTDRIHTGIERFYRKRPESGKELNAAIAEQLPDLILLDIMLPGEDGLEILSRLKASEVTKEIPVIMVTAKGAEYDKVMGTDCGADDYITKPFGMMEFIARVRAVLRRAGKEEGKRCAGDRGSADPGKAASGSGQRGEGYPDLKRV